MPKQFYNKIFITNLPSFYKLNLYNCIAEKEKILVIFTDETSPDRNSDFYKGTRLFNYISWGGLSTLQKIQETIRLAIRYKYDTLVIGGWDQLSFWLAAFLSPKSKNGVVVESSYIESTTAGLKGWIKKQFIKRVSRAYVSGKAQEKLVMDLGFNGRVYITKGVGIFNIIEKPKDKVLSEVKSFIYVGRLSPEKNLEVLIQTFNRLPNLILNIVGFGPQEECLKSIAESNIYFHGAVDNKDLPKYFRQNEVFILPSKSEPWGLVVEEAFNNGLPVIVSDRVGCADEIIRENENGLIFPLYDPDGLYKSILKITDIPFYNRLRKNVAEMDFELIARQQVNCYID